MKTPFGRSSDERSNRAGERFFCNRAAPNVLDEIDALNSALREEEPPLPAQVPAKQRRVLRCLRQGLTYKETGEVLGISPRTVRYYVSELIHRFHVENKVQLLAVSRGVDEPLDERKKEDE